MNTAAVTEPHALQGDFMATKDREQFKRLTIDIPASLHRSIKSQCALRGCKITDEIREMLIEKYMSPAGNK